MFKRIAVVLGVGAALLAPSRIQSAGAATPPAQQTIVFAGGCFWGVQSVFEHTKGVTEAVSGYAGGWANSPSYEQVSTGTTGHAESVKVTYDPAQVSLDQLLKIFFTVVHDPTQLNRQGPDVGTQYRSMIDYTSDDQKAAVNAFIAQMTKDHAYNGKKIVTQVVPYKSFFAAEDYHQHFAERNPNHPYIAYWDRPKVAELKKDFPQLYREPAIK